MDHKKKNNISQNKFSIDKSREFAKALQYHQSGQLSSAEEIYRKILRIDPKHSDSLHLMGVIAHQTGKNDIAIDLIKKAIQCKPGSHIYYNNLGNVFIDQGSIVKAISTYRKALDIKPDYAEAHYNLGSAFKEQGELNKAISCFKKALEIKPEYAEAFNNMGNVFKSQGELNKAISCYHRALNIKPEYAEVFNNMGNALKGQGDLNEAISCFKKALEIKPEYAEAFNNMGAVFQNQGELSKAMTCCQKALEIKPEYAEAFNNMGTVYQGKGALRKAITCYKKALEFKPEYAEAFNNMGAVYQGQGELRKAITCYKKALEFKPEYAEAFNNMGAVYQGQGELRKAITCYKKALEFKPEYAEAFNNMGTVFQAQGELSNAFSCYRKALKIKQEYAEVYYNLGITLIEQGELLEAIFYYQRALDIKPDYAEAYSGLFYQLQQTCAWQKLEGMTAKLDDFTNAALEKGDRAPENPFASLAINTDPSCNYAVAKSWSLDIDKAMSGLKIHFPFDGRKSGKTKITIGYLSNDFRNHAMAHLTLSLYGLHNRDEFKIFCYSYGEDDSSYYRIRIRQDCDKFVDIRNLGHADAARTIYEDQVDILVDLKGYLRRGRLEISALRPAPIQVRYLGLAGTTGAHFFDYIITDRIVTPEEHSQYYTENFVYMPHCYQINDHTQRISDKDWNKSDFKLTDGNFIFCSFNQGYKIEPVMFNAWMDILRQVPESVLWLQRESEITENNLRLEAERRGVKPARLIFSEKLLKDEHLGRLRLADLALDTRIVNGAITTSDALWAGAPVITLQGSHFASRMSSSILIAIGLPELITHTLEEYVSLAVDIAHNPDKLQMIRRKIMKNRLEGPLFDTPGFARNLEKAYKEMWEIFIAGQRPGQIEIVESSL